MSFCNSWCCRCLILNLHAVTCLILHFYNAFLSHFFVAPSLRAWIWLMMRWDTSVLLWWIAWPSRGNVLSLLQSHISCLVVLCGKHFCWHRTHRCHWLLFPCLELPSPCCWELSRRQHSALFVVCWKQEEGQYQSRSARPGISCAELMLAIGEENYSVQPWELNSQKLRELPASSQLMKKLF